MLGKDALCRNRHRDLRQFIQRFCPGLDKTRTRFFRQSLRGILNSGSLTVSKWLRWIPDACRHPFYRHKRLLNQLKSRDWDCTAVQESYLRQWAGRVEPDTPLIIDLTDLPRPRGRKLPYIRLVRDGSECDRNGDAASYLTSCVPVFVARFNCSCASHLRLPSVIHLCPSVLSVANISSFFGRFLWTFSFC